MAIPKTCKAAVFESANTPLVIKDVPVHEPKRGEVLVKVLACGVCRSDADAATGAFGNSFPLIPGHEAVGDVVAVGEGETKFKIGDRVGAPWHGGHDGTCKRCNRGLFQICENEAVNGVTRDGGYSEYVLLRTEAVVRVPKELDPAATAPLLCAGVTVFNGMRQMRITPGGIVAIQGLGGLGHLALQYANKMGYEVVALSSSASKADFAKKLGASHYVDGSKEDAVAKLKSMGGADMIVCTAPSPQIIGPLTAGLAPGGKLLILSPCGDVSINTLSLILPGTSVNGWPSGHALDSEEAIEFAQIKDVNCMIEKFPLKDAQKAFEHMTSGKARFRAVIVME
ncbi:MAG: hypothetical protein M1824_003610 [Vezdaea acicularis]|nr:MAG: hypothetical protein M1824_003610 [Vezdaea acicularis]